jgi:hypothetical protein
LAQVVANVFDFDAYDQASQDMVCIEVFCYGFWALIGWRQIKDVLRQQGIPLDATRSNVHLVPE